MTERLLRYFRDKQQDVQSEKTYDTQCPFCSMQCKMQLVEQTIVTRKKYTAIGIDNPTTQGRLCMKGMNAHQHALNSSRITRPLLKKNGEFMPVSWEEALNYIKDQVTMIQVEHGHDAMAVYGSASITNEEAYLLGKFARVGLQTKYIDYNGRLCMSAAATAANQTFGADRGLTNPLSDIPHTRVIILAGTNIAECQPTIMPYFEKAKENGAYIIAIDPRETATTKIADLHLKIKPGTDAALANGLVKIIIDEQLINEDFIQSRTNGFEELKQHTDSLDLNDIAEQTSVPLADIRKAAVKFAKETSGMLFTARGIEQQTDGTAAVKGFLNMVLITGKIGTPYSGYGAITGQGNGQGAREHGQKADQLPGYRSIENEQHRAHVAKVWGIHQDDLPRKGVSAYEMMEKINDGDIKGLFLMCSNPAVSSPNANLVKKALRKLTFFVAIDLFISETAKYADVILPASSYLEDEGTMTNVEGRVTLRETSRPCPGEAKHDWQIICDLASALGKGRYFSYMSAEDIFNELREASRGGIADYSGITYERLRHEGGIHWPCPESGHPGTSRLFTESFAHPDQKAALSVIPNEPTVPKEKPTADYPLYLTTGRVMSHYLTGVQTRKSAALAARHFESFMEIHPQTAATYNIEDRVLVKIESPRGSITVRSKLSEQIRKDTVFVPIHWADAQNVNDLIGEALDPACKMPGFKVCAVRIRPI
ncbi:assimilatory nitrate reductase catalytic subunit NasC [Bacillus subtilis]|uniref:assimilatory nitrate reductase catalytic subunit NasC n=1 Tax=Bacillus subtilis TaxID=1423 RepID=UPI000859A9AC|nr:assimilatory nitrate reductase catalytic subunit [Bacillus subtilis]AOR96695.1 Nitrate reductase [Bacillus subtilis]MDV3520719.1 assimilatory nitrate reductase catalytic subunit [Bacillus subtilis subsp. subtilis]UWJ01725.1 assimilatory nitrate reductase catalytic subunit [Bacillus subtilis]WOP24031.1 assimilatory nitrate reductase catalytic subunit [Bacillus subtilis]